MPSEGMIRVATDPKAPPVLGWAREASEGLVGGSYVGRRIRQMAFLEQVPEQHQCLGEELLAFLLLGTHAGGWRQWEGTLGG